MTTDVLVDTVYETIIIDEAPTSTSVITLAEQGPTGPIGATGAAGAIGSTGPTGATGATGGIQNIANASDVDTTDKLEGSILVYSVADQKWKATRLLQQQTIESGQY